MTAKILYFPTISEPTERAIACCTFCGHFEEISLEREIAGDVDGPTWCDQCGHYSMVGGEWEVRHAQVEPILFFEQYDVDDMLITVSNDADKLLGVYYGRYGEGTEPRELSAKLEALLEENPYVMLVIDHRRDLVSIAWGNHAATTLTMTRRMGKRVYQQ